MRLKSKGSSANAYIDGLWQQAAGEGVSVFVSAGDSGAAGCDDPDLLPPNFATRGIQANGFASTPYNVATGGTDFLDTARGRQQYLLEQEQRAQPESPRSRTLQRCPGTIHAPVASCSAFPGTRAVSRSAIATAARISLSIVAGGGAPSSVYSKPKWQSGTRRYSERW